MHRTEWNSKPNSPFNTDSSEKCEVHEGDSEFSKQLKKAISENLSKRYQSEDVRKYLLKATALDPRTKTRVIIPEDQDQDSLLVKRRNDNHSPGGETTWNELTDEVVDLMVSVSLLNFKNVIWKMKIFALNGF